MKKMVLMISVAAASSLMAGNIELYGQAHLSGDAVDNGTNSTMTLASNSSRLGVKASHALFDDLIVLAQFEMGVDLSGRGSNDDGNGGDFNAAAGNGSNNGFFTSARDSHVGISGNFGTVIGGNIAAQNQWIYDYNLFADQIGDLGNLLGGGGVGPDRASGTVAYITPSNDLGLQGILGYMAPSSNNGVNDVSAIVAKINYDMGNGFKAGLGYIGVSVDSNVAGATDPSEIAFSASYTQNMFSVGGGLAMVDVGVDRTIAHLGASVTPMDGLTIKGQYVMLSDDADNSDANMISVGVDYSLAKNATIYLAYAQTTNDANVNYSATNWGHGQSALGGGAGGDDPSALSVGFVYKFGGTVYKN